MLEATAEDERRHERRPRDFLVELGTEELPPLALPELERPSPQAFAGPGRSRPAARRTPFVRHAAPARRAGARSRRHAARADHQAQGPAGQRRLRQGRHTHGRPRQVRGEMRRRGRRAHARDRRQGRIPVFRRQQARASNREPAAGHRAAFARRAADPEAHALGRIEREFVRPVHWLVMLYGEELIPARILDTDAGTCHARPSLHGAADSRWRNPRRLRSRAARDGQGDRGLRRRAGA